MRKKIQPSKIADIEMLLEKHQEIILEQREVVDQHLQLFDTVLELLQKDHNKIKTLESDLSYQRLYFDIALFFAAFGFLIFLIYQILKFT